ncbi:hypothetical protein SSIG_08009 [Streptomyces filamentosus NRRL 11379]|nr:hypothetical protein SSIG_08009 [Streptomyces filamentosus NRRL 11379]
MELLLTLVAAQDLGVERLDDTGRGVLGAGGVGRVGDDRHLIKTFRGRLVRVGAPVPEDATGPILPCGPMIFEDHPHTDHDQAFSPTPAPCPYGGTLRVGRAGPAEQRIGAVVTRQERGHLA